MQGVVVENLGGNSYRLARWPWHRSWYKLLYLKVTKGSADENADYGVNVCMPGERVFTSLTVFSRLLVYLTFYFCLPRHQTKRKGGAILSSLIFFFETAGTLHPERRQICLPCQGWRWGGRDKVRIITDGYHDPNECPFFFQLLPTLDPLLLLFHLRSLGIRFCIRACVM